MTAVLSQTLYAPNPPQLDDPWLKLLLIGLPGFAGIALCLNA